MNIVNYGILDCIPSYPSGYVSKDLKWAAIPYGKKFMILHEGEQIHVSNTYKTAVEYIKRESKKTKNKSKSSK